MNDQALFDLELKVLLEAIYQRYHYDFRSYAVSSLRRRMRQAMQRYECERLADLQHRLLHEPELFAQAMQFFTVQVSEMFRDPAYFRELREQVVPVLRTYPSVKLWVAGCSTGEEVWSLAILLHEEGLLERSIVYATDINPSALATAEAGAYGIDRMAQFSRNLPNNIPLAIGHEDCQTICPFFNNPRYRTIINNNVIAILRHGIIPIIGKCAIKKLRIIINVYIMIISG